MTTRSYSDLSDSATTFDPEEQLDRDIDERMKGMSDWQPIETAPKNHTDVLLYNDLNKTCVVACWGDINAADSEYGTVVHEENWGWLISDGHNDPISYRAWPYVTHWRPLPAPPTVEGE
jgi:hypothetical protein